MFNRSDEPIFPRKEDGAFDYGEMAMISGRKTVDVIKGVDAFLRLVTAKYVIPVMNWSTKAAADMAIKGVDGGLNLLESGKAWHANREPVERTPFVGGAFDLRVREIWADVEVAAAELPDRTKPWLIRVVYASLLASTLYGVWPDRQNADIALPPSGPVVSGPATPGGTSVPWVPRPPRTGSTERGLPEVNLDAPIANANNLSVVSVFQYVDPDDPDVPDDPRDPDGLEGGPISYYNTISHFITKMKDPNTRTEEFTLFIRNTRTNVVEEKRAALDGNMLKIPGEDIRLRRNVDGMYEIRWRGTVNRIEAFRIKQNGVTNYVVAPQESTGELRRQLSDVLDGEEDVTILHTRGHLSFGTNTDLSSVVDPGIVI
mgnify:CR=1 FL=1